MTPFIVVVYFTAGEEHAEAFTGRVRRQAEDSLRLESGCRRFDVAVDPANGARVLLYEIYDDRAAFDLHLKSDHFLAFDAEVGPWITSKTVEIWSGPLG
jgi:quinol monooxygenase YgiN